MCTSLAFAGISAGVQLAGGTAGGILGYQAQKQAANYNIAQARRNQQIIALQAEVAKRRGAQAISKHRQQVRTLIGRQRAAYAASGVLVGAGTAGLVQEQARELGAIDEAVIRENTENELFAYEIQSQAVQQEIQQYRRQKQQAAVNLGLGLGFNLLDAGARFGYRYYDYMERQTPPAPAAPRYGNRYGIGAAVQGPLPPPRWWQ